MANEKRLIDAYKLEDLLRSNCGRYHCKDDVIAAIAKQPTVDAVDVVHGRWVVEKCDHVPWRIKNPDKWVKYKCSICGYGNGRKNSNYCPHCGAKMDAKE